jgi:hypothetical protein
MLIDSTKPDFTTMGDIEFFDFSSYCLTEKKKRERILLLREEIEEKVREYRNYVRNQLPIDIKDFKRKVGPGERILVEGVEYENILPLFLDLRSQDPLKAPWAWRQNKVKYTDWLPDETYKKGDHILFQGSVYEVINDHKSDPEKTPDKDLVNYKKN